MKRRILSLGIALLSVFLLSTVVFAHPGQTDADGGHYDRSTGEYHYHHGYPAHQHTGGQCPYEFDDRTGWNSGPSGSSGNSGSSSNSHENSPSDASAIAIPSTPFLVVLFISVAIVFLSIVFWLPFGDNYEDTNRKFCNTFSPTPKCAFLIFTISLSALFSSTCFAYFLCLSRGVSFLIVLLLNYAFWGCTAYTRYHPCSLKQKRSAIYIGRIISFGTIIFSIFTGLEFLPFFIYSDVYFYTAVKLPTEFFSAQKNGKKK